MPIYMDVHIVPGVKAKEVAQAHHQDLLLQDHYGCKCMTYWIDEQRENVFCLIDAPSKEIVEELHGKAHGLIPNKIIEVSTSLVESFLGRIYDPEEAEVSNGLKVFHDPSFRILLVTKTTDPVLLQYQLGKEKASELLNRQHEMIRRNISLYGGTEVEHAGEGFIISFSSAVKAVSCALNMQKEITADEAKATGFRVGLNAGEPVEKSNQLFGDTIRLALNLCSISMNGQVALSSKVKELVTKDNIASEKKLLTLSPQDEDALASIMERLETNWQNPEFNVTDYCQAMAMSKSQLYRKTIDLFDLSPNLLLKDYRLEKARDMLKKRRYSISQITFDCGFTSPSYFTKCFKKKYGILPMEYLELLP